MIIIILLILFILICIATTTSGGSDNYKLLIKEFAEMGDFSFNTERLQVKQVDESSLELFNKMAKSSNIRTIEPYKIPISKPLLIYLEDSSSDEPALIGGTIFSTSQFCVPAGSYIIGAMNIAEKYRRRGYAREALEGLLARISKTEIKEIYSVIVIDNVASRKLFEGLGFEDLGVNSSGGCSGYHTYKKSI